MDHLNQLPREINLLIVFCLPLKDILSLEITCKRQHERISNSERFAVKCSHFRFHKQLFEFEKKVIIISAVELLKSFNMYVTVGNDEIVIRISNLFAAVNHISSENIYCVSFEFPEALRCSVKKSFTIGGWMIFGPQIYVLELEGINLRIKRPDGARLNEGFFFDSTINIAYPGQYFESD